MKSEDNPKKENKINLQKPEFLKVSRFGQKGVNPNYKVKFNPSQFRTQHKGGGGK